MQDHEPIRARDVTPESIEWLWRRLLARRILTIAAGPPDQGKGLFCAHVAAEVSNMDVTDPLTKRKRKGRVLYSAVEDAYGLMTRPRLEAAGANLDNIDLWRFQLPLHHEQLVDHLENGSFDLVVMDPIAAHLSAGVSRYSDTIRSVVTPLSELAENTGVAILMVEHTLKRAPRHGHPLKAIGGSSSGLVSACRMAFLFGVDPDDGERRVLCCVKHNIREKPKAVQFTLDVMDHQIGEIPFLLGGKPIEFNAWRLIEQYIPGKMGRPPSQRAAATEWLTQTLWKRRDKPEERLASLLYEDAKQAGMTLKTLRRAAEDIQIVKKPKGGGPKVKWELPQDLQDMLMMVNGVGSGASDDDSSTLTDEDLEKLLDPGAGGAD